MSHMQRKKQTLALRDDLNAVLRCRDRIGNGRILSIYGPRGGHKASVWLTIDQVAALRAWLSEDEEEVGIDSRRSG